MRSSQWRGFVRVALPAAIGVVSFAALLTVVPLLFAEPFLAEAAGAGLSDRAADGPATGHAVPGLNGVSPTLQLVAFQPSDGGYLFTARLSGAVSHTQYVISSYHHTDVDYPQDAVTVTTDGAGVASASVWSRCTVQDVLTGYVFARLEQAGALRAESNRLDCPALQTVAAFGSHLAGDPADDDWVYRLSPPGPDTVRVWVRDGAGRSGLAGTVRVRSAWAGYSLPEQPLVDEGGGLYGYSWSIAGLPRADDYRVQLALRDGAGGLSGLDAFVKLSGRATWVWGQAEEGGNPAIWAILTNADYDENGEGDRDDWLAFGDAPYGEPDPYATTSYLSIYPYIGYTGTLVTGTFQAFLAAAHGAGGVRVEALAGTHRWVETDAGLQQGKDLCDAILEFNRAGATPPERFDGIHYDVEHDDWFTGDRWARFVELIAYCQSQVDVYNGAHEPIVFGVDIPPHFVTGPGSSGQKKSSWDVMSIVDTVTLMDYRDFAAVRWDGRTDGIIPRAGPFIADGNALGTPVVIGVELTDNPYDHVTFYQESAAYMEAELREVSRHFAADWAYKGLAVHGYGAWREKARARRIYLPVVTRNL